MSAMSQRANDHIRLVEKYKPLHIYTGASFRNHHSIDPAREPTHLARPTSTIPISDAIDEKSDEYRTQSTMSHGEHGHDDSRARFEARMKPGVAH
jgi:hypothetical protein